MCHIKGVDDHINQSLILAAFSYSQWVVHLRHQMIKVDSGTAAD